MVREMIVAVIPAKGESSRLPGKNLLLMDGEPLVARAVRYAKSFDRVARVLVSTDSDEIAACAASAGAEVVRRGSELGGDVPLLEVYRHAVRSLGDIGVSHMVGIQPDHPDRQTDINAAIEYTLKSGFDEVFTVDREGRRNGALRIMSSSALNAEPPTWCGTILDDCTNIHTPADLLICHRRLAGGEVRHLTVEGKGIGEGQPVFIVAEAGGNHMGSLETADEMIRAAARAGADAIKFQTYKAERMATPDAVAYWRGGVISQIEHFKRTDGFGADEFAHLFDYARQQGIIAFSTPFDLESATMLHELGMGAFKIASGDLPNTPLLRHVAGFGKPVMLSTGAATPEEIDQAVDTVYGAGNFNLILLACTLSYPTAAADANLKRITSLKERYPGVIVGISDHTEPEARMVIPALSVALGASVIEKHFTLDRSREGSGHFFAVTPDDLDMMVANIRLAEQVLGDGGLGVAAAETRAHAQARRSLVAARDIAAGETITAEMVTAKRPAGGLSPTLLDQVIGKRTGQAIKADTMILAKMLE